MVKLIDCYINDDLMKQHHVVFVLGDLIYYSLTNSKTKQINNWRKEDYQSNKLCCKKFNN